MASRLSYALPIARQLLLSTVRRMRPGGLAATLPKRDEPFVIVTGSGRSGTSAVARVLHESGISLGNAFDPPSQQNRAGFYEETAMRNLNLRIVGELGLSDVTQLRRWPWRSSVLAVAERYRGEMRDLAAKAGGGWKDPFFSITLEPWLQHLPRRPQVVICLRSSEAYLRSVAEIYGLMRRDAVERIWAYELRRLLDVIYDYELEATCIEYDDLVQRPGEIITGLSAFLGKRLDAGYIEPGLRHHAYAIPRRHVALYEEVRAVGSGVRPAPNGLRAGGGDRPALREAMVREIDAYLAQMRALDERVAAAQAAWREAVRAPEFSILRYDVGPERERAFDETRAASEAYVATLTEAQDELAGLVPPVDFERFHQATQDAVDGERLVAQVALHVAEGQRPPEALPAVYERCLSPEAVSAAQRRRDEELERGIKDTGYRPAGAGTPER